MKEKSFFSRIFGTRNKQPQERKELREETQESETPKTHAPCVDEVKRNADFWNMVHSNMGKAHLDAGNTIMASMGHAMPNATTFPKTLIALHLDAFQNAVKFAQMLTKEGKYEAMAKKYGTDNLFELFVQMQGGSL